jgi:hypothetical protein
MVGGVTAVQVAPPSVDRTIMLYPTWAQITLGLMYFQ